MKRAEPEPRAPRLATALYRRALRLLPADVRQAYADGMSETFQRRAEEIWKTKGTVHRIWFLVRELVGLMRVAVMQRSGVGRNGSSSVPPPRSRGREMVRPFLRDLRYAVRGLRKTPAFTFTAIATLAIGLGANTAIFTLLHRVVLNPLPYAESNRLVALRHSAPGVGAHDLNQSPGTYFHYRDNNQTLEEMGLYQDLPLNLTGDGEPQRIRVSRATASLFRTLRAVPAIGRLYGDDDDQMGASPVTLLSHSLWASAYGTDPEILGRTILLNGTEVEVIGVMPAAFTFPSPDIDAWIPAFLDPTSNRSGSFSWDAIGRMRPGVKREQVQTEFNSILQSLPDRYPGFTRELLKNSQQTAVIHSLKQYMTRGVHDVLWILLGSVGVLLAIACANVANLFLVRAEARQREVAVRTALGASVGARFRHHLAESLTLGTLSAVLGVALAIGAVSALVQFGPQQLPRLEEVRLGWQAVLFCAGLALTIAFTFSILTMLRSVKRQLHTALRESGSATPTRQRHRLRNTLVVSQVALALVLLISSGLLLRSFWQIQRINPGFDPANVLTMRLSLPRTTYQNAQSAAEFHQTVLERIRGLPGVIEAGVVSCLPLTGWCGGDPFVAADQPLEPGEITQVIAIKPTSPGYFRTLGIPLVAGRTFDRADHEQQTGVAIVSKALADRVWPGEDPIGKLATTGVDVTDPDWFTIVGVVESVRMSKLTAEPAEIFYRPLVNRPRQAAGNVYNVALAVRTASEPLSMAGSIRNIIRSIDPDLPIAEVRTMQRIVDDSMMETAFTMWLLILAALFALLLGAVGLYGVISYVVGQRRNEIGVRMALGARSNDVIGMVIRQAGMVASAGVVVGLVISVGLTRLLNALLFNVSPTDLVTYLGVTILLLTVAGLAGYMPARRAAKVDPARVLRAD